MGSYSSDENESVIGVETENDLGKLKPHVPKSVEAAIEELGSLKGVDIHDIVKFLGAVYGLSRSQIKTKVALALKRGLEKGTIVKANGFFRINSATQLNSNDNKYRFVAECSNVFARDHVDSMKSHKHHSQHKSKCGKKNKRHHKCKSASKKSKTHHKRKRH